jgi:hypothetical protein
MDSLSPQSATLLFSTAFLLHRTLHLLSHDLSVFTFPELLTNTSPTLHLFTPVVSTHNLQIRPYLISVAYATSEILSSQALQHCQLHS